MKHLGTLCGASLFIDTEDEKVASDARQVLTRMAQAYFQKDPSAPSEERKSQEMV